MPEFEKSDIIKNVLSTLLSISSRKTTQGYAIDTLDTLVKQLEQHYNFLRHIQITDTRFSEDDATINVMSDINGVESTELGKAIHDIITTMNRSLGKQAGHFFIKEIRARLGDDYTSLIKDMGVDLNLMQLESEVTTEWEKLAKQETNV